jgi:influenza virus NS1A-binding protein
MREARGRFDITVIDGKVYAVGGCNGTTELATAEVYSSYNAKWTALPPLESARSNIGMSSKIDLQCINNLHCFCIQGVCDLGGKVYCIGGWNGQCGMKQCNVFDPAEGKWQEMAPLNYGI